MADVEIPIDLQLRDAADVFAREKQDTAPGPQREAMRRRLLRFVEDYDAATHESDGFDFIARHFANPS
jgi:hypothetical protein